MADILTASKEQLKVKGRGSIVCEGITFKNVLLVENMKYNLLSVRQMIQNNWKVVFDDNYSFL